MDRPTKPSGRHAVRLRWDEIITRLSFRFNFLAIRDPPNPPRPSRNASMARHASATKYQGQNLGMRLLAFTRRHLPDEIWLRCAREMKRRGAGMSARGLALKRSRSRP